MISYIKGILTEVYKDSIVVEGGNVGYSIRIPTTLHDELPSIGREVKIYTYLNVREDAMNLFGFLYRDDMMFFKLLIGVNGIGPKGALGILSAISADELRFAILSDDAKFISKAPGIGLKTAQKLILELKGKLSLSDAFELKTSHMNPDTSDRMDGASVKSEVVQALTALGYSGAESLKAVSGIADNDTMTVEELIKAALKKLAF